MTHPNLTFNPNPNPPQILIFLCRARHNRRNDLPLLEPFFVYSTDFSIMNTPSKSASASLDHLPPEILYEIINKLDTARDVSHFASTTRHNHARLHQTGWKSFVRSHFPDRAAAPSTSWNDVANRLTYLDRCWDTRALNWTFYREWPLNQNRGRRGHGQSVFGHAVVDCCEYSDAGELLAWGLGENVIIRKKGQAPLSETWHSLKGADMGYSAGDGDVTAISAIKRLSRPEVVVGRANGNLQFLSADGDSVTQTLNLPDWHHEATGQARKSPGHSAVSWTEWNPKSHRLAVCRSSAICLFDLSRDIGEDLLPFASSNAADDGSDEFPLVRSAKFLGQDTFVCGLGNTRWPLRWCRLTNDGLRSFDGPAGLGDDRQDASIASSGNKTTVRAIETIRDGSLILSSWDDGTIRYAASCSVSLGARLSPFY